MRRRWMKTSFLRATLLVSCAGVLGTACDDVDFGADSGTPLSDASPPSPAPTCERADVEPVEPGRPVWSAADAEACDLACSTSDSSCFQANCPGYADHSQCLADSFDACITAPRGLCRAAWESSICCARGACAGLSSNDLASCIEEECGAELDAYVACADDAFGSDTGDSCFEQARDECLLVSPDGGAEGSAQDGGGDASGPDGGVDAEALDSAAAASEGGWTDAGGQWVDAGSDASELSGLRKGRTANGPIARRQRLRALLRALTAP